MSSQSSSRRTRRSVRNTNADAVSNTQEQPEIRTDPENVTLVPTESNRGGRENVDIVAQKARLKKMLAERREQSKAQQKMLDEEESASHSTNDLDDDDGPDLETLAPTFDYNLFLQAMERTNAVLQNKTPTKTPSAGNARKSKRAEVEKVTTGDDSGSSAPVPLKIDNIYMGNWQIEAIYNSPYPLTMQETGEIHICEFCLHYVSSSYILQRHLIKCPWKYPPGNEIYRSTAGNLSCFEVDGNLSRTYCQNLCLLSKVFLYHKTLFFEVEFFLFYVLTRNDDKGCHFVGYFSKVKMPSKPCNVSCLLVLPPYQEHGYGSFLIDFSYLLSRKEGKIGTPERPLSDLGLISYRSYWKNAIAKYIAENASPDGKLEDFSVDKMSLATGILSNDIISTLQSLRELKYWRKQHFLTGVKSKFIDGEYKYKPPKCQVEYDQLCWTPVDYSATGI